MQRNALKCGAIKSKIMQSTAMYAVKLYCYSVEQNGMQCKDKTRGTKLVLKHYLLQMRHTLMYMGGASGCDRSDTGTE